MSDDNAANWDAADLGEMEIVTVYAKHAGFKQVTADPDHVIALIAGTKEATALRAQLAESAAREVQLRTELTNTRASIQSLIVEAKTLRGISSHAVITFGGVMIGDIDRGLAAPPSAAAAELQQRTEVADAAVSLSEHADRLHASCDCIDIPRFDCCTCGAYEASEALAWLNRQVDALAVVTKAREVKP